MSQFQQLFGRLNSVIIGMVHLRALPGSPRHRWSMDEITSRACKEAAIYRDAKADGILVENMHDLPWQLPSSIGPETTACMAAVCKEIRTMCPHMPIGIQVLSACNKGALAIAKAVGLDFIRAEGFVYSHIGDEGPIHSCAADLLRYRKHIDATHIQIYTDIKKKHSSHAITSDVDIMETARTAEMFDSDGLIVTGAATGEPTDIAEIEAVCKAVSLPVLVGSGVTVQNISKYMFANGIIIGSAFKQHGLWYNDIDPQKVSQVTAKVEVLRAEKAKIESTGKRIIMSEGEA